MSGIGGRRIADLRPGGEESIADLSWWERRRDCRFKVLGREEGLQITVWGSEEGMHIEGLRNAYVRSGEKRGRDCRFKV